jgi:hypothetical protein
MFRGRLLKSYYAQALYSDFATTDMCVYVSYAKQKGKRLQTMQSTFFNLISDEITEIR